MTDTANETQSRPNLSTEPGAKGFPPDGGTETQPAPNISTEHQREGDARHPSDTLDRGQPDTPGGMDPEDVEDRPNVSTVTPEDYPEGQRGGAS